MEASSDSLPRLSVPNLDNMNGNGRQKEFNPSLVDGCDLLKMLMENLPDRIYFKDTQSRFIQCNRAVAKRVGVEDPKQIIGKTDFDFYSREKAEEFRLDDQRIIQTGEPLLNKTEQVTKPNGEITVSSVTKVPLRDEGGNVVGLVGISRDITDQKQAEKALRQSHDELEKRVAERTAELSHERLLLRTLIDNLPDGIYAKDTAGRKTLANPADLKTLRCKTEAEAIGKTDFDLFPQELAKQFYSDDQKVIHGEPVINREEYFVDGEGQKRWLLTSKLPLCDQNGIIIGLVGIGRDITERKRAEEMLVRERLLLRTLMDNLPEAIYFKDLQSHYVCVSLTKVKKNLQLVRERYQEGNPSKRVEDWPAYLQSEEQFAAYLTSKTDFDVFPEERARAAFEDEQKICKAASLCSTSWNAPKLPMRKRIGCCQPKCRGVTKLERSSARSAFPKTLPR